MSGYEDLTSRGLRGFMAISPAGGLVAALIYAMASSSFGSVFAVGIAVVGAASFAGLLLGFLFGLPKTLERTGKGRLTTNTNLDQISDWLTKILVGLGLVQLGKVSTGVSSIAGSLAPALGNGPGAKSFGVALLIYSVVDGFLVGYIWTRIDLSKRFRRAAEDLDPVELATDKALATPLPKLPPPPPPPSSGEGGTD